MPGISILSQFTFGDMVVEYLVDDPSRAVGLRLYPAACQSQVVAHRPFFIDQVSPAWRIDSLAQFKLLGDPTDGFTQGHTMRNSATLASLRFEEQEVDIHNGITTIITRLFSPRGYACEHRLSWPKGSQALHLQTTFINRSDQPLTLELLSSFSLGGITPFAADDAPERLFIHRFRSAWSAEGRHECRLAEDLSLEPSWAHHGVRVERFGQVGSMPVRGFFPWVGVEDRPAGVMWGAQLAIPGSWQMEIYRRDDYLCLSGGQADREFGHWTKTIPPGESFASAPAYLSTVYGDLDDLCARLVSVQQPAAESAPASERDLPVICNEWCTSWGNPRHADLEAIAKRLSGTGVRYLVIDAGWYKGDDGVWSLAQGDWVANSHLFPQGLAAAARAIRQQGMIPGIWFEMEVVGEQSPRFEQDIAHFLQRDGKPVTAGGRRFWDFRDPWVVNYLGQKVIEQLREGDFGYIKVDYNETLGIGCDAPLQPGAPGEGLRQHLQGVQDFFRKMRSELPDLVIENCSSGGHRLEPSMMALTSMASFSDAHESPEIPVIAANLHRLILPRQSQIWAVLHASDSMARLAYSLSAGFLGRLCLSGEIASLNEEQWALVQESLCFYAQASPLIARGTSRVYQSIHPAWRHLQGAQTVLRLAEDQRSALLVMHSFASPLPTEIAVPLPMGTEGTPVTWQVQASFPSSSPVPTLCGSRLVFKPMQEWQGSAVILKQS